MHGANMGFRPQTSVHVRCDEFGRSPDELQAREAITTTRKDRPDPRESITELGRIAASKCEWTPYTCNDCRTVSSRLCRDKHGSETLLGTAWNALPSMKFGDNPPRPFPRFDHVCHHIHAQMSVRAAANHSDACESPDELNDESHDEDLA